MTKRNARALDTIAADIHALLRTNIIGIGRFLNEAHGACEYGDWCQWLANEFEWSAKTADRYRAVATLADRFVKLSNLKLAKTTLYSLIDESEDDLPAIIQALEKEASRKFLKAAEAENIIFRARCKHRFGDLPEATLRALDLCEGEDWFNIAAKRLKKQQPATDEVAEKILHDAHFDHVARLYAEHGKLPAVPTLLSCLENVPPEHRASTFAKLSQVKGPITAADIIDAAMPPDDDDDDDDEDQQDEGDQGETPKHEPEIISPLPQELLTALMTLVDFADKPCPRIVSGITYAQLSTIMSFVKELQRILDDGNAAKRAADRAEARSRMTRH
jgi:hypothetical protein